MANKVNNAFINIWNVRIGAIAWNDQTGLGSFEFDNEFAEKDWDISPILMPVSKTGKRIFSFPENKNSTTFKGLPGLLADMLPDKYGNALINSWLAAQGRPSDSLNPVETLCFIGKRAMGALEVEPVNPKESSTSSKVEIKSLIEIADHILNKREKFKTDLSKDEEKALLDILKIGSSAGGARAKALIAYNTKTKEVRSGQANAPKGFSHWIIKFDGVADSQFGASKGYGRVEMAYHLMAKAAGIEMTECDLYEENGRAHFMTKRFDRIEGNEKLHLQSFCALRHFDFNNVGYYSYEQLFETMRILGLPFPEAEQLFRRMVFNVVARNCDDHTKNFAFLMNNTGKWKLSPAFDVCHAYRPGSSWVSQQSLTVNGKRQNINQEDFMAVAKQMNIKKAKGIIEEVTNSVSNWKKYADEVHVQKKLRDAIYQTLLIK
jgi:serine/threonine-protein kinase HipA